MINRIGSSATVLLAAPMLTGGVLVDEVTIPTNGQTVSSAAALAHGVEYRLEASGTFQIGGPGDGLADAEYADFSNPPDSLLDFTSSGIDLGVSIDGDAPDWGPYQPDHVYSKSYTGRGAPLSAGYVDSNYADNFGSLTLRIYLTGPCGPADLAEPFGLLDLSDVTAFISAFIAQQPAADLNGDTLFDLRDINAFIAAFQAGCP